jgi:hypothetical protein
MADQSVREEIRRALANGGRMGSLFQGTVPGAGPTQGASDALITMDLPAWAACAWTITVANWDGNPVPQGAAVPTQDNFVIPFAVMAPPIIGPDACGTLIRVEYGVDGAREVVWFDAPIQGTTFTVHAAHLRVYVDNMAFTPTNGAPQIGAFAAPGERESVNISPQRLTTQSVSLAFGATHTFYAPPRARAYRAYSSDGVQTANLFWESAALGQAGATGAPFAQDANYLSATVAVNGYITESNRAMWFPLDPRATTVQMKNAAAAGGPMNGGIQWLIDIG